MTTISALETPHLGRTVDAATVLAWHRAAASEGAGAPMVIDVRSAPEYGTSHIRGSFHVPLPTLAEHTSDVAALIEGPVVLVCQSGVRAEQARRHLAATGLERAHVLDGGLPAYTAAGGDIVRGPQVWALERQVRLVAGVLVLAGLTAGRFISPKARLLAGGIGAGLTFSAVSNTCAMGAALARLPLNRDVAEPEIGQTLAALRARRHEHPQDAQR
ncbi:Rhodanese-related sulfurtransferase [Pseudonocardia ammonioxydans]|uniref:Rhodanese-related sulfurtransferase n=1 Tax=Pseudonocardia ammonioxydans TaxID=260086 RepID=A0A1I5IR39_PSUAM|nr:rhodanese-like domain-containing protein [Pseudonocardia ammonioxydans]SFO62656.1 Rhodanese-related sulfurtransferase [Pseudonocardia ammonioxydans]